MSQENAKILSTYDSNWEDRIRIALEGMDESIDAINASGVTIDVDSAELSNNPIHDAFHLDAMEFDAARLSQYRTTAEYVAACREELVLFMPAQEIIIPEIPDGTEIADVDKILKPLRDKSAEAMSDAFQVANTMSRRPLKRRGGPDKPEGMK